MPLINQDKSGYSLVASLDNVRNLSTVLKAIHFREQVTGFGTKNGIKVTVENATCVQANACIRAGIFQDFKVQEEPTTFLINLTVLLDYLSIFWIKSCARQGGSVKHFLNWIGQVRSYRSPRLLTSLISGYLL